MTDRAHPAQMNESDLWLMFYKLRIEHPFIDSFGMQFLTEHGGKINAPSDGTVYARSADADLAEFRKRYPHRVFDDKPEDPK